MSFGIAKAEHAALRDGLDKKKIAFLLFVANRNESSKTRMALATPHL